MARKPKDDQSQSSDLIIDTGGGRKGLCTRAELEARKKARSVAKAKNRKHPEDDN